MNPTILDEIRTERSSYSPDRVRVLLSLMFTGTKDVDDNLIPDPDMPKAKGDPATGGSTASELLDIKGAWSYCLRHDALRSPEIIEDTFKYGFGAGELAEGYSAGIGEVIELIDQDVATLARAATLGRR